MSHETVIRLDLPATTAQLSLLGACIGAVVAQADELLEAEVTSYNLQLAASELFTNIVGHAYAGIADGRVAIVIRLGGAPRRIAIELRDQGSSFDRAAVPLPDLDEGQIHGYGLFLVEQLMDEVRYQPQPGGNAWQIIKYL